MREGTREIARERKETERKEESREGQKGRKVEILQSVSFTCRETGKKTGIFLSNSFISFLSLLFTHFFFLSIFLTPLGYNFLCCLK